jgi:hypothetical protein
MQPCDLEFLSLDPNGYLNCINICLNKTIIASTGKKNRFFSPGFIKSIVPENNNLLADKT